jgi:hypothetical protein
VSLLADIEAETRGSGPRCTVQRILGEIDPAEVAELEQALDSDRYTGNAIARALSKRGFKVGPDTILRHRRRDCSCLS